MLEDVGRVVAVEELRRRISPFSMRRRASLRDVPGARQGVPSERASEAAVARRPSTLPLLAKAFVLWGQLDRDRALPEDEGDTLLGPSIPCRGTRPLRPSSAPATRAQDDNPRVPALLHRRPC